MQMTNNDPRRPPITGAGKEREDGLMQGFLLLLLQYSTEVGVDHIIVILALINKVALIGSLKQVVQ